jgi:ribosomal protein S18 acetylase RimI-like enzyme
MTNASPASELVIRRATAGDVPALGRMAARLVDVHHQFDPQRFFAAGPGTPASYAAFLGRQITATDAIVLVAELAAVVVGYAYGSVEGYDYMSLRGPAGVVHDLFVDGAHRRRGVARRLLEATLADLHARGVPRVVLSTADRNDEAQRLFARLGFRRTMIEMTRESGGLE